MDRAGLDNQPVHLPSGKLDKASILDLVAADVIEGDYYFKDERFSIAPSILTKQYCSIIEHEVNEIIQLLNLPNKP